MRARERQRLLVYKIFQKKVEWMSTTERMKESLSFFPTFSRAIHSITINHGGGEEREGEKEKEKEREREKEKERWRERGKVHLTGKESELNY